MWLIVGLGNPGQAYQNTRHNLGYQVISAVSSAFSIPFTRRTKQYSCGSGTISGREVILLKPLTFMNRSGTAVREAMKSFGGAGNVLIIHDDIDLETGVIKIRRNGSAGGHRGVESIIDQTGTKDSVRLKVGIGRPVEALAEDYVLEPFKRAERPVIKHAVETAVGAVEAIICKGIAYAQNHYHRVQCKEDMQ